MEHGSIEQHVAERSVITLFPTIALHGTTPRYSKLLPLSKRAALTVATAKLHMGMLTWMERSSYSYNESFEVWHVAPDIELQRQVFHGMVDKLEPYIDVSVAFWGHYDEETAVQVLLGSPHLGRIYDADSERLERCWRHRGYRLPIGGVP